MGLGVSIFLVAVGAILTFAVEAEAEGIDVNTVGVILMCIGLFGLFLSLFYWNSWGGFGGSRTTYVRQQPIADRQVVVEQPARRRTVLVEEEQRF